MVLMYRRNTVSTLVKLPAVFLRGDATTLDHVCDRQRVTFLFCFMADCRLRRFVVHYLVCDIARSCVPVCTTAR